jgi:hypothetical protein
MKNLSTVTSIADTSRRTLAPFLALAMLLLLPAVAAAAENKSGLSLNFTPVLIFPTSDYRLGGGVDPELKYTLDLGAVRLSAGGRVGTYYAKNLFGVTVMPTLRVMVPAGPVEPYAAVGMGYGWLPKSGHEDLAMMARLGVVFRFSKRFAIGVEGTLQQLDGSNFRFPSLGSMMSFDL